MNEIWGKKFSDDEILKEVLLCRGFIPEDPENLAKGLSVNSSSPRDMEYLLKAYKSTTLHDLSESSIKRILNDLHSHKNFAYGFTGKNDFSGSLNENFQTFKKCKFGVKIPVDFLDRGIALLVKTLPLIGVMTSMSCGGHLKDHPNIIIRNQYHLNWVRHVFSYLFGPIDGISFLNIDSSWQGCRLVFETIQGDESSYYESYWKAQKMARFLLDHENSRKIREAKDLLENEDQLNDEGFILSLLTKLDVKKLKRN